MRKCGPASGVTLPPGAPHLRYFFWRPIQSLCENKEKVATFILFGAFCTPKYFFASTGRNVGRDMVHFPA